MNSFSDFLQKFLTEIKPKGFVESMRNGSTGVGYTLEQMLGITENSFSQPDFIAFLTELKTKRTTSKNSLLTLYTDETGWTMPQIDFIEKNGWNHRKHVGEKTVQGTIRLKTNKRGFALNIDDEKYFCVTKDGVAFMKWEWDPLLTHYMNKFANLVVVDADVKKVNGIEHFHYTALNYFRGTSKELFRRMIENNKIGVDLRLYTQYNEGKGVRNRGTALRIKHKDVKDLYTSQEYFS